MQQDADEAKLQRPSHDAVELSPLAETLLKAILEIKPKPAINDYQKLTVSRTASIFALVYEKVRNAIEYREDHLLRRAAIERILRRRLALNPKGASESENVLRELLWARYFKEGEIGKSDVENIQHIINTYLSIKSRLTSGRPGKAKQYLNEFLLDIVTAEIEEELAVVNAKVENSFTYFIFQVLKDKVKIEKLEEHQKDLLLFIAIEKAYRKSDRAYQRYHLFRLFHEPLHSYNHTQLDHMIAEMPNIFHQLDKHIHDPLVEKLVRFSRKQLPPFLILFSIIKDHKKNIVEIVKSKDALWSKVEETARNKYAMIRSRLNTLAFRSLIYIFVTKMLLALALEVPISQLIYNEVNLYAIGINTVAPPIFMLFIILTVSVPGENNTRRLFLRILDIVNRDTTFEKTVALIAQKAKPKRPLLSIGFTILYTSTFVVTLYIIHKILQMVDFNLLSESIFVFFISVVAFFSYRIKQIANTYRLIEKKGFLQPVTDFFFMPILSLGKLFSEGVSRINVFIVFFDFIIEAPFKLVVEVVEEWITFVRQRKEEIV
ncbi:hypothetical protein KC726_05285 [Candidatus Woesebacteria bacterium]|nr:hypothetical protein [Candidatus Woesebacteria bacterium]